MTRWLQVWGWAEENDRTRRLQEAIDYFRLDPTEVLGRPEVENELLERYTKAVNKGPDPQASPPPEQ